MRAGAGAGGHAPASVVELRVWGVRRVGPALARTAAARVRLRTAPGLRFAKALGTGSGRTFTPRDADPHRWALLTVWDTDAEADDFARHPLVRSWKAAAEEQLVVRMRPLATRGRWSRVEPFRAVPHASYDGPVAAITRARLRTTRTLSFWRAVPPVVVDLGRAPGVRFAIGIGEAPIGLQGTFSLWHSGADLNDFAYRGAAHRDVVERTRSERWYAEELFARLAVLDVRGTYRGTTP